MDTGTASRKAKVKEEALLEWETGTSVPSIAQARRLATAYRVSYAEFLSPAPPFQKKGKLDRRTLPHADAASSELVMQALIAEEARVDFLDVSESLGEPVPRFAARLPDALKRSTEDSAVWIRTTLDIDEEEQLSAGGDKYGPYNYWRARVENCSVLVRHMEPTLPVSVDEARGFCIFHDVLPVAVINQKDAVTARLFTLLHEFVHIALAGSAVVDQAAFGNDPLEVFCNAVAGRVLVPSEALERLSAPAELDPDDPQLKRTARRFGVSTEVIARRYCDQGAFDRDEYRQFRQVLGGRQQPHSGRSSGGSFYNNTISRIGKPFILRVLEARSRRVVSEARASSLIGGKVSSLDGFAARVAS